MGYCVVDSPLGRLKIEADDVGITAVGWPDGLAGLVPPSTPLLEDAARQLAAYFDGTLRSFDLPLHLQGTPFRMRCWEALQTIPYGETISYGEQARRIGNPKAVRAVGGANHHNPVCIIVPCHRVIGADGSMTGYGGGVRIKEWLLLHERKNR